MGACVRVYALRIIKTNNKGSLWRRISDDLKALTNSSLATAEQSFETRFRAVKILQLLL